VARWLGAESTCRSDDPLQAFRSQSFDRYPFRSRRSRGCEAARVIISLAVFLKINGSSFPAVAHEALQLFVAFAFDEIEIVIPEVILAGLKNLRLLLSRPPHR
jgi:hypothetical protein